MRSIFSPIAMEVSGEAGDLPPQECIDRYLETKDEKYLSRFLHWHEPTISMARLWMLVIRATQAI